MAKRSYVAMSKRAAAFLAGWEERRTPTPGGNADDCQNKGVARKAIYKTMKTKGEQFDVLRCYTEAEGYPTPRYFAQRVRKLLKGKDGSCKKSGKRE